MVVLRRHFFAEYALSVRYVASGHPWWKFWHHCCQRWIHCWKTRSRPIGVRVCPVGQFNFFSTASDPREWTMVVFWKEDSGRQLQLITPENEGGDNTNYLSPPTFFDNPEVPFGPSGPLAHVPEPHESPDSPGLPPGLPPGWPPAPSRAGGRERVGTGNTSRERLHPRPTPPEPQLIPVLISDREDDDDQPTQGERKKGNGLDRVSENLLTYKCHKNQKFNLFFFQNLMMIYQMMI